jgi:hypothetical protein
VLKAGCAERVEPSHHCAAHRRGDPVAFAAETPQTGLAAKVNLRAANTLEFNPAF